MALSVAVRVLASGSLAMPKSVTLICPLRSSMMFCGLMSRWTTPPRCACSSARRIWMEEAMVSFTESMPLRCIYALSVMPSMYSITIYLYSPLTETSKILTMLGCESMRTAFDSLMKRCTETSSAANSSLRILTATVVFLRRSSASKTIAMPPMPTRRFKR